jgi:hypothetical protein
MFLTDFVVREGEKLRLRAGANERLVHRIKTGGRGELTQDPAHIAELRPN